MQLGKERKSCKTLCPWTPLPLCRRIFNCYLMSGNTLLAIFNAVWCKNTLHFVISRFCYIKPSPRLLGHFAQAHRRRAKHEGLWTLKHAAWFCPTCNPCGAIDSDLVIWVLCYLTTPWSCQVGRTIQMMRIFRFTLNSLSKKPAHGTAGTLIANKFF